MSVIRDILMMFKDINLYNNTNADDYIAARDFEHEYKPLDNREYDWVYEYAKYLYEKISDSIDVLDKKADNLIKYLIPGSGMIELYILYRGIYADGGPINMFASIGIIFVVMALLFTISAVKPMAYMFPPTARSAIKRADHFATRELSKAHFSMAIYSTTAAQIRIMGHKSKMIHSAYVSFAGFILWLLVVTPIYGIISVFL